MKLNTAENEIVRSGNITEGSFRIKNSAKAFEILCKQLYSDIHSAIVRELSTNALDAHKAAKNESNPFDVHLPNNLEPYLIIRDYGTGLSHDAVMTLYTTYFESDKSNSDEFVGCFGLGSKTPFAYSDNFTVRSFYNGKARNYTLFKSEDGSPKIALLDTQDTDVHNGLEITIPVRSIDIDDFILCAAKIYAVFPKDSYRILGYDKTQFSNLVKSKIPKVSIYGNGWNLEEEGCNPYLVMGNIRYKISLHSLGYNYNEQEAFNLPICIYANVGDVDISASREDLHYNKKTLGFLKERIKKIYSEFGKKLIETIQNAPSLYEARQLFAMFKHKHGKWSGSYLYRFFKNNSVEKTLWKGQQLFSDEDITIGKNYNGDFGPDCNLKIPGELYLVTKRRYGSRKLPTVSKLETFPFDFCKKEREKFIINDVDKIVSNRVQVFVQNKIDSNEWINNDLYCFLITKEQQKILGIPDNFLEKEKVSDFPKVVREKNGIRAKSTKISLFGRLYSNSYSYRMNDPKPIDLRSYSPGRFIEYSGNWPNIQNSISSYFFDTYKELIGFEPELWYVTESVAKKLRAKGWIDAKENCKQLLINKHSIEEEYLHIEVRSLYYNLKHDDRELLEGIVRMKDKLKKELPKDHVLNTLANFKYTEDSMIGALMKSLGVTSSRQDYRDEAHKILDSIANQLKALDKYPLFILYEENTPSYKRNDSHIIEYIKWCDSITKEEDYIVI